MNYKKILAGTLATTMVLSSSLMAFAGEDETKSITAEGAGTLEGFVATNIFSVTLPTNADTALTYIADPQNLIANTKAAAYSGKTFEPDANVFFTNASGDYNYSSTSDKLTVINKSSAPLKVSVTAKATKGTGSDEATAVADESTLTSATTASVLLTLTDGDKTSKVLGDSETTFTQVLGESPEGAYVYKHDASGYTYALADDVSSYKFAEYSLYVTGEANEKGWTEDTKVPTISVKWDVDLAGENDEVTVATPEQTPAVTYDLTVSAATASVTWDRTQPLTVKVDETLVADMSVGDFGVNYNGKVYTYNGVYKGNDTTIKTKSLASLSDNVITISTDMAQFLPAGDSLFIIDASGAIVSVITVN
jgi:hypothetical protein